MLVFNRMCVVCLLMLLFKMRCAATMDGGGEVCLIVRLPHTVSNEPAPGTVAQAAASRVWSSAARTVAPETARGVSAKGIIPLMTLDPEIVLCFNSRLGGTLV